MKDIGSHVVVAGPPRCGTTIMGKMLSEMYACDLHAEPLYYMAQWASGFVGMTAVAAVPRWIEEDRVSKFFATSSGVSNDYHLVSHLRWVEDNVTDRIVKVIRHPAAFAYSMLRQRWSAALYVSMGIEGVDGSSLKGLAMFWQWCAFHVASSAGTTVVMEEFVKKPEQFLWEISTRLEESPVTDPGKIASKYYSDSYTSDLGTGPFVFQRNAVATDKLWREHFSREEVDEILKFAPLHELWY